MLRLMFEALLSWSASQDRERAKAATVEALEGGRADGLIEYARRRAAELGVEAPPLDGPAAEAIEDGDEAPAKGRKGKR